MEIAGGVRFEEYNIRPCIYKIWWHQVLSTIPGRPHPWTPGGGGVLSQNPVGHSEKSVTPHTLRNGMVWIQVLKYFPFFYNDTDMPTGAGDCVGEIEGTNCQGIPPQKNFKGRGFQPAGWRKRASAPTQGSRGVQLAASWCLKMGIHLMEDFATILTGGRGHN